MFGKYYFSSKQINMTIESQLSNSNWNFMTCQNSVLLNNGYMCSLQKRDRLSLSS